MSTRSKQTKHPPTLLIDGDIIAYKAASAVNRCISFDGDNHFHIGSLEEAKVIAEETLASLLSGFKTKHYIIAMTDPTANWRNEVYPPYKSNRKDKPRPVVLGAIKDYLQATHPTYQRPTLEADDILGILATSDKIIKHPGEKIIVSADKDMKTLPGLFYDLGSCAVLEISEAEADCQHMLQTLTGDTVDGYPGCPGIGPVKAARILEAGASYAEWWPLIVAAYAKAGLTEEDALIQARVARILRVQDYNFKNKEVKLWAPTSMKN